MKVNEIIRKRRKELGLTLKDVATELGVSESLISRYESNDVKNMGIDKLIPLAKVLKCTPAFLMGAEDEPKPAPAVELSTEPQISQMFRIDTRGLTPEVAEQLKEELEEYSKFLLSKFKKK